MTVTSDIGAEAKTSSSSLSEDLDAISRLLDVVVTAPKDNPVIALNLRKAKATMAALRQRLAEGPEGGRP